MPYYLEIARLRSLNYSQRKIASTIHCRRDSVSDVFKTMDAYQLTYEKMKNIPTEQLEDLFEENRDLKKAVRRICLTLVQRVRLYMRSRITKLFPRSLSHRV